MAESIKSCRHLMRPEDLAEQDRLAALAKAGNYEAVRVALAMADAVCRSRLGVWRSSWVH